MRTVNARITASVRAAYENLPLLLPTVDESDGAIFACETLYGIARRHGTTAASIAAASNIDVDQVLSIGQSLWVVIGVRSPAEAQRIAAGVPAVDHTSKRKLWGSPISSLAWGSLYRV